MRKRRPTTLVTAWPVRGSQPQPRHQPVTNHERHLRGHPRAIRPHQAITERACLRQTARRQRIERDSACMCLTLFRFSNLHHSPPTRCVFSTTKQAYDGHMNLILGDVEETIMIVDVDENENGGSGRINVRTTTIRLEACCANVHGYTMIVLLGCKAEDGNAFRTRRWGDFSAFYQRP